MTVDFKGFPGFGPGFNSWISSVKHSYDEHFTVVFKSGIDVDIEV